MTSTINHDAQAATVARWGAFLHARNVITQLRAWWVSLLAVGTVDSLLTVLALGVGMGVVVDRASPGSLGVPFLSFVAPAMVLTVMVHGAQVENTSSPMAGFRWHETYHAAAATPTKPAQLATGHIFGTLVRCLINALTVSVVLLLFGGMRWSAVPVVLGVGVLVVLGFGNPVLAWTASLPQERGQFALFARLIVLPLTLFSGTYFPLDVLPVWTHPIGWLSPLWHGVNLARIATLDQPAPGWLPAVHIVYLSALALAGWLLAQRLYRLRLLGELRPRRRERRTPAPIDLVPASELPDGQEMIRRSHGRLFPGGTFLTVAARGLKAAWGTNWLLMASGVAEPILYLLAMGLGLGSLIGRGDAASYAAWIAPALLASSAMNGAVLDATWNVFIKLKLDRLYDAMLSTSLSPLEVAPREILVALVRGGIYAAPFVAVMAALGLVGSWWVLAAVPACLLIAFGFAALGMAATSFAHKFQHLDWITVALLPMFLFSGTFYPIDVYPAWIATGVRCLPLWHGIEMMRDLTLGTVTWITAGHALYFVGLAILGTWVATFRIKALFLT